MENILRFRCGFGAFAVGCGLVVSFAYWIWAWWRSTSGESSLVVVRLQGSHSSFIQVSGFFLILFIALARQPSPTPELVL